VPGEIIVPAWELKRQRGEKEFAEIQYRFLHFTGGPDNHFMRLHTGAGI